MITEDSSIDTGNEIVLSSGNQNRTNVNATSGIVYPVQRFSNANLPPVMRRISQTSQISQIELLESQNNEESFGNHYGHNRFSTISQAPSANSIDDESDERTEEEKAEDRRQRFW